MEKSVDYLVSEFFLHCDLLGRLFHQLLRGLASHQCKFHFDSMYGGLDTPYCSNNMKIPGCLNHLKTVDDYLEA